MSQIITDEPRGVRGVNRINEQLLAAFLLIGTLSMLFGFILGIRVAERNHKTIMESQER